MPVRAFGGSRRGYEPGRTAIESGEEEGACRRGRRGAMVAETAALAVARSMSAVKFARFACCCCVFSSWWWALLLLSHPADAQLAWTSIYVDGKSQVDLWTASSKGCQCPWNTDDTGCACCVKDGGCHCGTASPNRCMQCGLEEHCTNMCNVTIDSMTLMKQSGRTFGQIKSRVFEGPSSCWYSFVPSGGQRVELQVYRLVSVGRLTNGSTCVGGSLRLLETSEETSERLLFELCGANERYDPPVVVYSDGAPSPTRLEFTVEEKTSRSQFLAYFSFTSSTATNQQQQQLEYAPRGGTRLHNTRCDWLYQDFSCSTTGGGCVMASPGYPGLYPPATICTYYVTTSSVSTRVRLVFRDLRLAHGRCDTDYLAVHEGSSRGQARLLRKFCGTQQRHHRQQQQYQQQQQQQRLEVEYAGPNLLIEFGSGPAQPPFDYNGFVIELHFEEGAAAEDTWTSSSQPPVDETANAGLASAAGNDYRTAQRGSCDVVVRANDSRSGHFDTRGHDWTTQCRFVFSGASTDVVHVSLFNYKLRSRSCNTVVEVWDGEAPGIGAAGGSNRGRATPLRKICSPATRHARDRAGSFLEHETFVSSGRTLSLVVRRSPTALDQSEFVDGAYLFHDERALGTARPGAMCDTTFYGLSSAASGTVVNAGGQHLYWNVEGELVCRQRFVPAANQSVTVSVRAVRAPTSSAVAAAAIATGDAHCVTRCGDGGCECAPDARSHKPYDNLRLVGAGGATLICLCGDRLLGGEAATAQLPVTVRTWSPLTLVYSLADYSWNTKGFEYSAVYEFERDATCGSTTIMAQSGEIRGGPETESDVEVDDEQQQLNNFQHRRCTWILDSNVERQLYVELSSNQSRPCGAWNITLHEYSGGSGGGGAGYDDDYGESTGEGDDDRRPMLGELLHTFCPRDRHKSYSLPWKLNTVVVRLRAMSRTPPQYRIKWRSQVVRANTRLANPTPAPNAVSSADALVAVSLLSLLSTLRAAPLYRVLT